MNIRPRLGWLWRQLTEPLASVKHPETRLQARWLASLLVIAVPLGLGVAALPGLIKPGRTVLGDVDFQVFVGSILLWAVAYTLSRMGRYEQAAMLTINVALVVIFTLAFFDFELHKLNYVLLPILFGSVILRTNVMLLYIGLNLALMLFLCYIKPDVTITDALLEPMSIVGIGSALMLILARQQTSLTEYRRARLAESEARYRTLFEDYPISIWEEDFSAVKTYLDGLKAAGVEDFQTYFEQHPKAVSDCVSLVNVLDANQAALQLYGATSKEELIQGLDTFFTKDAHPGFAEELVGIAEGKTLVEVDAHSRILKDKEKSLVVTWRAAPGHEVPLSRCFVSIRDVTERQQAEQALRESEKRYRVLFENTGTAICVFGEDRIIQLCNQNVEDLIGLSRKEVEGRMQWSDFVSSEDLEKMEHYHAQRGRGVGAPPQEYEFTLINAEGNKKSIYMQIGLVEETKERIASLVDITPLKHAQRALRASEDRFRSVVEQSTDGIMLADAQGRIIVWNEAMEQISGLKAEEALDEILWHVVPRVALEERRHHVDHGRIQDVFRRMQQKGFDDQGGQVMEQDLYRPDGTLRTVLLSTFPIATTEGYLVGSIMRDITVRKQAEEALIASQHMVETILQNMPGGSLVIGEDYVITRVNQRTCEITGYSESELVGSLCDIVCPKGSASKKCPIWEKGEDSFAGMESAIKRKDGQYNPILKNAQRISIDGKRYILENFQDITERKEMERQLRQQERLAAVGQLAAGVAHDFRNLLSTIILYAQLPMRNQELSPKVESNLRTIVNESYKATDLVQQMLDFSSRAMIERRMVDLPALVRDTLNVLERTIPEHIHLTLDVPERGLGTYRVKADPRRIQQALTNLTLNARDAMPDGGELRFAISRHTFDADDLRPAADMEPGDWICLTVSDSGMGMTEEVKEHLFEPFFTTKEVGKGTGLGLAQVYGIIRQHEGRIDVESTLGEGTTFRLYLLAYDETLEEIEISGSLDLPHGHGETVLLVEDEEKLRAAGRVMLESLGYQVMTAANGREALAMCQSARWLGDGCQPVDLIITDLVMPKMGGRDLLREIHKIKPGLPVVAITGYALQEDDLEMLSQAGFVRVLFKPMDVDMWAQEIRYALES